MKMKVKMLASGVEIKILNGETNAKTDKKQNILPLDPNILTLYY